MKTLITVVVLSLISQLAVAQKNFEGKIIYRVIKPKPSEKKSGLMDTATITVYFGVNKIKALLNEPDKISEEKYSSILGDFTQGKFTLINLKEKEFKIYNINAPEEIQKSLTRISFLNKTILNLKATAYTTEKEIKSSAKEKISPVYWYADTLYYLIDTIYSNHYTTRLFTNGKNVCLGKKEILGESGGNYNMFLEALSIEQMKLADSVFTVPSDFLPEPEKKTIIESDVKTDSIQLPSNPKKLTHKKSSSKSTHIQPTKPSAIKSKE